MVRVIQALVALRDLEFTDVEVEAVLGRARRRPGRSRRKRLALALATLALAGAGAVAAVLAGRAGLSDAIERFFAGGPTPGSPFPTGEHPGWLDGLGTDAQPRVLARSGGRLLVAYRAPGGGVCFDFGGGVGLCSDSIDPRSLFGNQPVLVFGPTEQDAQRRWILWGVALDSVKRVELRYADAPPTEARVTNGFVLRADPNAKSTARTLVAFAADGRELASIDVRRRFQLAPVGG
jgi:hypothetical protein